MYRDKLSYPAKLTVAIVVIFLVGLIMFRLSGISKDILNYGTSYATVDPSLSVLPTVVGDAALSVVPAVVENGGSVTLEWKNVPDPSERSKADKSDWIGLFCPSSSPSNRYIDYWSVSELVGDNPTSDGRVNLILYNVRTDCQFRYFTNDPYVELIAVSNKVSFVDGGEVPLHIHLALTGDPSEMRLQWTTGIRYTPTVEYGQCGGKLEQVATGTWRTYKASDMCGPPANLSAHFVDPGYIHDVLLRGLKPNRKYCYRCGSPGFKYSSEKSFTSPIPPGSEGTLKFIVYGDMGTTKQPGAITTAKLVFKEVEKNDASLVLHVGDLSYSMGVAYQWDKWMSLIEPYSSQVPYMINVGNHEQEHTVGGEKDPSRAPGNGFHPSWGNYGHDSGGECGVPVYNRFHMPENGNQPWWYSFENGLVHFTVLSTEHNFTHSSPQYTWLENDLKLVDRTHTPWIIVATHRPMYSSQRIPADFKVATHIRQILEPLFYKNKVNLFVSGHIHSYERTCPVYQGACVDDGMANIVVGSGGTNVEDSGMWKFDWSKHFEDKHGYGRVTIANASWLLWEFVRNMDNRVTDSAWIHNLIF